MNSDRGEEKLCFHGILIQMIRQYKTWSQIQREQQGTHYKLRPGNKGTFVIILGGGGCMQPEEMITCGPV